MAKEEPSNKFESVAIILAAGSSSRLGQPKQLLKIGNESLLRKTVLTVINSGVDHTIIILGAGQKENLHEIDDLRVRAVVHDDWQKGMGSSLKCGVRLAEEQYQQCESIVIAVCDQPLLTSSHLKNLIQTHRTKGSSVVASFYAGSPGVPALFHRSLFKKLLNVEDKHGAKQIINDYRESASFIEFEEGAVDIDTPDDWKRFNQT